VSNLYKDLAVKFGDKQLASNSQYTVMESGWQHCRVCERDAVDLAVLNKNDEILCSSHFHHDHMADYFRNLFDSYAYCVCWGSWINDAGAALSQFRPMEICSFCNEAEGAAKRKVGADKWFTFTPDELKDIIIADGPGNVRVNADAAKLFWEMRKNDLEVKKEISGWMFNAAITGKLGPSGHPLRRMELGQPNSLRKLTCDGGYANKHQAKKLKAAHGESE